MAENEEEIMGRFGREEEARLEEEQRIFKAQKRDRPIHSMVRDTHGNLVGMSAPLPEEPAQRRQRMEERRVEAPGIHYVRLPRKIWLESQYRKIQDWMNSPHQQQNVNEPLGRLLRLVESAHDRINRMNPDEPLAVEVPEARGKVAKVAPLPTVKKAEETVKAHDGKVPRADGRGGMTIGDIPYDDYHEPVDRTYVEKAGGQVHSFLNPEANPFKGLGDFLGTLASFSGDEISEIAKAFTPLGKEIAKSFGKKDPVKACGRAHRGHSESYEPTPEHVEEIMKAIRERNESR